MASSSVRLHAGARSISRAPALSKQIAGISNIESLRATRLSVACRKAVAKKQSLHVQARVKRKDDGVKGHPDGLDTLRMPWAVVAAATALVSLGATDEFAYADTRPQATPSVVSSEIPTTEVHTNILGPASLSAPVLVSEQSRFRDSEADLPSDGSQILLTYEAAEPLQHAFNPEDFRAKLPNGAGPLGGGEWSFSATRSTNRSCPAWGSNPNIEMVVPGAAKALQPHPPRGSRRWFASFGGQDTSQLQRGGESEVAEEGAGAWELLEVAGSVEVAESAERSGAQKEGEAATVGKNPFEGLVIEIVRMPVFSCFSL